MLSSFKSLPLTIRLIVGFSFLLALAILVNLSPWLRGGFGWRWQYDLAPFLRSLPLIFITFIYIVGAFGLVRHDRRVWPVLLWAVFGTFILGLAVAYAQDGNPFYALFTRTASYVNGGPHWAAPRIDWQGGEWRNWTEVMARIGGHTATSPPGATMFQGLLNDFFNHTPVLTDTLYRRLLAYQCQNYDLLAYSPGAYVAAIFGVVMPLIAGLAVFPLYATAKQVFAIGEDSEPQRHRERRGFFGGLNDLRLDVRYMVIWWPLVPGIAAFAPTWSTVYPVFSIVAFYLLARGLNAQKSDAHVAPTIAWFIAAGLVSGVALFINFAFAPILGMLGFYVLLRWLFGEQRTVRSFLRPVIIGVWVGIGLMLPWLIFWLASGETIFDLLRESFNAHLILDRPYAFWVWMHVWDWALWAGMGLALVWLVGLWRWGRQRKSTPPLISLSLLLTVLTMTISGTTQGESGRIWLFLVPFLLLAIWENFQIKPIGEDGTRHNFPLQPTAWRWLTLGQAALFLALTISLNVIGSEFMPPPDPPIPPDVGLASNDAVFSVTGVGEVFRLHSWRATQVIAGRDETGVSLRLWWQGIHQMTQPYTFGAFFVLPDGTTTEPVLWQPGEINGRDFRYPTTCWQPGMLIEDSILLPLPQNAVTGDYWISLAVFGDDSQPESRLAVTLPDGSPDIQIGLGPIRVESK